MTKQAHERRVREKKQSQSSGSRWAMLYAILKQVHKEEKKRLDILWRRDDCSD